MAKKIKKQGKQEKKDGKQLNYIIMIMAAVIIIFFIAYWLFQQSKKFDYNGLQFEKITYGSLPLYHAKIPITDITGSLIANFNLFLRNDPRKLENIPVGGNISLMKGLVIAIDENLACEDNGIAGTSLGQFLMAAGIDTIAGTTNINETEKFYANCSLKTKNFSVLIIEKADETEKTSIVQENENCYKIEVANCEIVKATERFMVGAYANSKGYSL